MTASSALPVSQLVLFLDSVGIIHAESPGLNGFRQKIDLPHDFAARNPELMAVLRDQQFHRSIWQREQDAQIKALAKKKKEQTEAAIKARENDRNSARARGIYYDVAEHHSLELANRVIDDPARRPVRKVVIYDANGTRHEVSPRNTTAMNAALSGTAKPKRAKKIDQTLADSMEL